MQIDFSLYTSTLMFIYVTINVDVLYFPNDILRTKETVKVQKIT